VVRHHRARVYLPRFPIRPRSRKEDGQKHQALLQRLRDREPWHQDNSRLNLVKELQARKIQIDGVGLESHFKVGSTPSVAAQVAAKKGFLDLGVDVAITELDVRFVAAPYYTAAGEATQAQNYYDSVASCMQVGRRCRGITVWDFDDTYSWVPSAFAGQGGADIYNETLQRKPAYYAIAEAITGGPCTVC